MYYNIQKINNIMKMQIFGVLIRLHLGLVQCTLLNLQLDKIFIITSVELELFSNG
jgi:hypothetical protein